MMDGERIRLLRDDYLELSRMEFAGAINLEVTTGKRVTHEHVRSWETRGVQPRRQIRELLERWMREKNVPEISVNVSRKTAGPTVPSSLKIYEKSLPDQELGKAKKEYEGTYICFYDEGHTDHGNRVLFTRRYCINDINSAEGCLFGSFSTPGGAVGVAKFIFSPTPAHRALIYMIEFEKERDHPPVSGIIRAVKIRSQRIGREVFFTES